MKVIFKGQEIELPVNESELTELIMVLHEYIPKPAPIFGQWRAGWSTRAGKIGKTFKIV